MKTAFSHQFMVDLTLMGQEVNLPSYLKDLIRQGDISDNEKLEEFLTQELPNVPLQNQVTVDYFLFLSKQTLQLYLYRQDFEGFNHTLEVLRHRMTSLSNAPETDVNMSGWTQFLDLMGVAFNRILRHVSIEAYEAKIDQLDWTSFDKPFIAHVSRLIGYVYLQEDAADQRSKSRLWLQKSLHESEFEHNLANYLFISSYYLSNPSSDHSKRLDQIIDQLKDGEAELSSDEVARYFSSAIFELEAQVLGKQFANFDDNLTRLEYCQQQLRDLELLYGKEKNLPSFSRAHIDSIIATLYSQLYHMTNDDLEQAGFSKYALRYIDRAIENTDKRNDTIGQMYYRQKKIGIAVTTKSAITEKEVKETVQFFKKSNSYPAYIKAVKDYFGLLTKNETTHKSFDVLLDIFKLGNKRIEQGGFYLIASGFSLANDIFLNEAQQPGISWMIHELDTFFEKVKAVIESLDEHLTLVGTALVESFRFQYERFEPASHFNIKVYLAYQLYQIKMIRLGTKIYGDSISLNLIEKLIDGLENNNNPLSFIKADWDEFKKVPNSVRNHTLNKCISISKGDLPLAAEHLDFSYRNLRSYITFKEVNRLGFFLDLQETDNKQLEQGIRFMFFDLYKKGTIFEVVFDMPKFLVRYAKKGFFSQDLEKELNIKGTTAKKYIKIMMEIKLIRQDKTTGRKHYYRLIRENVMNRLAKDLTILKEPQSEFN